MIRSLALLLVTGAMALSVPAGAVPGGKIGTLPLGRYLCALPGDATGPASTPVDGAWFDIVNASGYEAEGGRGTYLLTGDDVVFTRGPMKGEAFIRETDRTLRRLDQRGEPGRMACTRQGV